ncbi:dihydrodipicolinate synthase family protein [Propioniciclava coleopterorum]|uniref:Dihydrodipicolinate synthase family protein n=1 Tax=Propioniciclava coleopterorum TaxID=2714937 RepID=A0A6G7Y368_9ACTN|nr:dihydrodipicolinate synthase family protein [Propioniciclava coleopterorum]QIK71071.1 dihydrodipicolinate synthase family protein [Propioniciclava coleopterorum]
MTFTPHGAIPALVTPLDEDGELMEQGLRDVLDHVIAGGVHGVFVLGSSGEIYGLHADQKRRVVELTVEHVAGRVPVYAGASEITTRDCVATASMAERVGGVAALSVLTPYFMTPTQDELVDHYRAIAESTSLPVILYTNPGRTHVDLELDTVLRLAQVPGIVGLKDSAGDLAATRALLAARPEGFAVLMGRDTLIEPALAAGAEGCIASTANIAPALVAGIYDAHVAGDHDLARARQDALTPLRELLDKATFPVVLKEGLRMAGVDAGHCLAPARALSEPWRSRLRDVVAGLADAP